MDQVFIFLNSINFFIIVKLYFQVSNIIFFIEIFLNFHNLMDKYEITETLGDSAYGIVSKGNNKKRKKICCYYRILKKIIHLTNVKISY